VYTEIVCTRWLRRAANADDHAIVEQRIAEALHGRLHAPADDVVGAQEVLAARHAVVHVEDVLAVRAAVRGVEREAGRVGREDLGLAVLEVVTTGKDDALVFGKLMAVATDRVGPMRGARESVVDEVAVVGLAVRRDAEHDDVAEHRRRDPDLVDRLILLRDRFGED
jgi:hypothetical protein